MASGPSPAEIRAARLSAGWSVEQLAEHLDTDAKTVKRLESVGSVRWRPRLIDAVTVFVRDHPGW